MPRCFRVLAVALLAAASAASAQPAPASGAGGPAPTEAPAPPAAFGAPYPNPFVGPVTLTVTLDRPSPVRIELFDALGQRVAVIADESRPAGVYDVRFDGSRLVPGLYVVRLTAGSYVTTRRLVRAA